MAISRPHYKQAARTKRTRAYYLHFPSWVYRTALLILIERSNASWGLTFRTYNRLPTDSEVFQHARHRRWDDVRIMLDAGRASLFDVDDQNVSLLHIAVWNVDCLGYDFLLQRAAGRLDTWRLRRGWVHVTILIYAVTLRLKSSADAAIYLSAQRQILASVLPIVDESSWYDAEDATPAVIPMLPSECTRWVTKELFHVYDAMDMYSRAVWALNPVSFDAQTVHTVLGSNQTLPQAFRLLASKRQGWDHRVLFASIAEKIGFLYNISDSSSTEVREWIDILAEVIAFETTTTTTTPFFSALWPFLNRRFTGRMSEAGPCSITNDIWTNEARTWIRLLKDLGVNLELYGRAESKCLLERGTIPQAIWYAENTKAEFQIFYMTYGPEVDDWVSEGGARRSSHCKMVAESCNAVEDPEVFNVPGAFIPDNDVEPEKWKNLGIWVRGPCL